MNGFWAEKRVLLTGHTGFKGSWLSLWLAELGADVFGLAMEPETRPALFEQLQLKSRVHHKIGDIRRVDTVRARVAEVQPDIVIHLAAQPLVLASYVDPLLTWETNVMGTAHVLEAIRGLEKHFAVVMVTTDKVYENHETGRPYREDDRLGGHDPYSASKAASELVIASWCKSFFAGLPVRLASARSGNVIGGGDWSINRILPDLARAQAEGRALAVRNPHARRVWQHVLEPLSGYLRLAQALYEDRPGIAEAYNFGPDPSDMRTVRDLVQAAYMEWPGLWHDVSDSNAPHEASQLSLTIDRARDELDYVPRWDFARGVRETVVWYRAVAEGADPLDLTRSQIRAFGAP